MMKIMVIFSSHANDNNIDDSTDSNIENEDYRYNERKLTTKMNRMELQSATNNLNQLLKNKIATRMMRKQ